MKTILLFIVLICFGNILTAQNDLYAFDNLINKTWRTDTNWKSENPFFQEITFEYALDSTLILTKTKGYIDKAQTKIGDRNFGVRQFDKSKNTIYFVEYDIFGGKTEGHVKYKNRSLVYTYIYGDLELTEKWIYINPTTYEYKIGVWTNNQWETLFLESKFIQVH